MKTASEAYQDSMDKHVALMQHIRYKLPPLSQWQKDELLRLLSEYCDATRLHAALMVEARMTAFHKLLHFEEGRLCPPENHCAECNEHREQLELLKRGLL